MLCNTVLRLRLKRLSVSAGAGPGLPWAAVTASSSWSHIGLQPQASLYDPLSQSYGPSPVLSHHRLSQLQYDHMHTSGQSQSPEGGSWYNVPLDDAAAQPPAAASGSSAAAQYQHRRAPAEQVVPPQLAVRDSNVDFDTEMAWSDDEAPPPLPTDPPPLPVSSPTLHGHTCKRKAYCLHVQLHLLVAVMLVSLKGSSSFLRNVSLSFVGCVSFQMLIHLSRYVRAS